MGDASVVLPSLLYLPDELLSYITELLDLEFIHKKRAARPAHVSLALTCRRLSGVVRNSIFRDLCFDKLDSEKTPLSDQRIGLGPTRFFDRLGPLLKVWEKDQAAGNHVRSFYYRYKMVHITMLQSLFRVLSQSNSLKRLTIVDCEERIYMTLQSFLANQTPGFCNLTHVRLETPYPESSRGRRFDCTMQFLHQILAIPALKHFHLQAGCSETGEIDEGIGLSPPARVEPPLEELHLMHAGCGPTALKSILQLRRTRALIMPHRGNLHQDGNAPYRVDDLLNALQSLRRILHTLGVTDSSMRLYGRVGGSFDLRNFTALKKLMISQSLLLQSPINPNQVTIRNESNDPIFPQCLEELAVFYDGATRFEWDPQREELQYYPPNLEATPEGIFDLWSGPEDGESLDFFMSWMRDLLTRKPENFPYLQKVTVWSCPTVHPAPPEWIYRDILPLFDREWADPTNGVETGLFIKMGS